MVDNKVTNFCCNDRTNVSSIYDYSYGINYEHTTTIHLLDCLTILHQSIKRPCFDVIYHQPHLLRTDCRRMKFEFRNSQSVYSFIWNHAFPKMFYIKIRNVNERIDFGYDSITTRAEHYGNDKIDIVPKMGERVLLSVTNNFVSSTNNVRKCFTD